ncbi:MULTISPECIES: hypothetical protein [Bradyrhizobium]|uniref:Uncharacterized protein n=1 Tax=Bradyrhizobium brasilense TaxID=1419277 RepID=A0A1G7DM30_9BRAD|nr:MULTISPECIES: hypothetical protein [Bradyrhizobium]MCA6102435.1 hypothetical protein [Bradyrhizobium australafricanum]MCC8976313.1 hypothetical protein [Bradyrhizobium brasilense]SDE52552.1 hypothetical protein SAMN05216337_102841 [Bradyrhizobium brasilense]
MRIAKLAFAGSLAAVAAVATPALAKSTERQKADEKSTTTTTSSGCQAYQQAADGTWNQLPCGEAGSNGATQHRPAAKGADDDEH